MIKKENSNTNQAKRNPFKKRKKERDEFEQKVVDIARVTRVVKGGKRFSFRTVVVIGDKKGRVGVGTAKGPDMKISTEKSFAMAKKNLITLGFRGNTIPHQVYYKMGSAKILLKPAPKGNGIVAGGAVRTVVSLAGITDISGKMLGSKNKLNNARAAIKALEQFSIKKTRSELIEKEIRESKKDKVEKDVSGKNKGKKEANTNSKADKQ